jgi:hypothetical protein
VEDRAADVHPDAELQPEVDDVGHERLDSRAGVAADQHPGPGVLGQLRHGCIEHPDLVLGVVGVGVPGTQQRRQRLAGGGLGVVDDDLPSRRDR